MIIFLLISMPTFNDIQIFNDFCRQIEEQNFQKAREVLFSKNMFTEDAAHNFFSAYIKSSNEQNWLKFWNFMVSNFRSLNPSQQNWMRNVLKISIEFGKNEFILPVLDIDLFNTIDDKDKIITNLIFRDTLPNYLQQMIIRASTLNSKEKDVFFNFLIQKSLINGHANILMFINEHHGIEFFKSQINTLFQNKFFGLIMKASIRKKVLPLTFMIALISTADDFNLCNLILKESFKNNYTLFIEALLQEDTLPGFLQVLQNMSTTDRDIIINSLAINIPRQIELVNMLLERLEPLDLKIDFYNKLMREAFNFYNKILLDTLSAKGAPFNPDTVLAEVDQVTLQQIKGLDNLKVDFIQNKMVNFVKGYGYINYNDALLTLAQRRSRKNYEFNPVLINQDKEMAEFFDILAAAQKPIVQSFVYASSHYVSGLISIDKIGQAKIILIDSLGTEDGIFHKDLLRDFSNHFPNNEIYISKEPRQKNSVGCSVFALDDIAHLPQLRIEGHENIWDYLEESNKTIIEIKSGPNSGIKTIANSIALPLSLMRTMQSRALLNDIIPQKPQYVQAFRINKKEQTTSESVIPFFKDKLHSEMGKLQNTRLDYKLDKMKQQNFQYLLSRTEAEVSSEMQYFTLQSFGARTVLKQSEQVSEQNDLDKINPEIINPEDLTTVRGFKSDIQSSNRILAKENKLISKTQQDTVSQALLIKSNVDDFFSKVWERLYDLFSNFGSSIQIENQEIKIKYQALTQSYNALIDNEEKRNEYQKSDLKDYELMSNVFEASTFAYFNQGFLQTDWTQQYSETNGNLQFPKIEAVERHCEAIMKDSTEVELGSKKIKPQDVYTFMKKYKESIIDFHKNLTELNQELQKLKANLLAQVREYNQKNPNRSEVKKEVMKALEDYLQEADPERIKQTNQDLTTVLQQNPGWAEGLISKRFRTAVESASQIIEAEDLAHKSTPFPRK